jgi:hypothetical protein
VESKVTVAVGETVGALGVGRVEATLDEVVSACGLLVGSIEMVVVVAVDDDENAPIPVPADMTYGGS